MPDINPEADNSLWQIRLFGALEVEKPNGEHVALSGKKAGELLAYLAIHPYQSHQREKLIDVLWNDSDIVHVRTRLRQEIAALRSLFPAKGGESPLLRISSQECQLQPSVKVDAIQFLEACSTAKQEMNTDAKIRLLAEACALYRFDLLSDYSEVWIHGERVRFSQIFEQALYDLAEAYRENQQYANSEETLNRLLIHNPLMEEAHVSLMRIYADLKQPTRILQQYQTLERSLHDKAGVSPSESARNIAENLRINITHPGSVSEVTGPEILTHAVVQSKTQNHSEAHFDPFENLMSDVDVDLRSIPIVKPRLVRRHYVSLITILLVFGVVSAGLWHRKRTYPISTKVTKSTQSVPITRHTEKLVYLDKPKPGELPNAEARGIVYTDFGMIVTGNIQTEKEDTDILTMSWDSKGTIKWRKRYSSPEHDCDRAFSICKDSSGGVYVGGETYIRDRPGKPGEWHMLLLHYDPIGKETVICSKHTSLPHIDGIDVVQDTKGGCFICGDTLVNGKQTGLLMHCNAAGKLLWEKPIGGINTHVSRLNPNGAGNVYWCGTSRSRKSQRESDTDCVIGYVDSNGKEIWSHPIEGPALGNNSANKITTDRAGDAYVGGIFCTVDPIHGGHEMKLGVAKYGPKGDKIWLTIVQESGPEVALNGMEVDYKGDFVIGGTEILPNGNSDIVLARYNTYGEKYRCWHYTAPTGFKSAALTAPMLFHNGEVMIVGEISTGDYFILDTAVSSVFRARFSSDCSLTEQSIYDSEHNLLTVSRFATPEIIVGQVELPTNTVLRKDERAFMVLHY